MLLTLEHKYKSGLLFTNTLFPTFDRSSLNRSLFEIRKQETEDVGKSIPVRKECKRPKVGWEGDLRDRGKREAESQGEELSVGDGVREVGRRCTWHECYEEGLGVVQVTSKYEHHTSYLTSSDKQPHYYPLCRLGLKVARWLARVCTDAKWQNQDLKAELNSKLLLYPP